MADAPTITATAAQVFVSDIKAACDFYTRTLGFATVFVYGDPPFYAQVRRGRGVLNLRHVDRPVIHASLRDREDLLSADLALDTKDDVDRLFDEFSARNTPFHRPIKNEAWGARNFIVKDPDGNLILFAGPAK